MCVSERCNRDGEEFMTDTSLHFSPLATGEQKSLLKSEELDMRLYTQTRVSYYPGGDLPLT